jgi:hypothetical protein
MAGLNYIQLIADKMVSAETLAKTATKNPVLIAEIFKGLNSPQAHTKYKSIKVLNLLSRRHPALLYPYFDIFVNLLDGPNNILKWNALDILANLVKVDEERKFDSLFSRYYDFMNEGSLITAAHVVESSPVIVQERPDWEPRITWALLSADTVPLPTEECRNILAGKVILAFGQYFFKISESRNMLVFAEKYLNSTRSGTKKKAEQFIKKYSAGAVVSRTSR